MLFKTSLEIYQALYTDGHQIQESLTEVNKTGSAWTHPVSQSLDLECGLQICILTFFMGDCALETTLLNNYLALLPLVSDLQ